jgi:hypothetical protein
LQADGIGAVEDRLARGATFHAGWLWTGWLIAGIRGANERASPK